MTEQDINTFLQQTLEVYLALKKRRKHEEATTFLRAGSVMAETLLSVIPRKKKLYVGVEGG